MTSRRRFLRSTLLLSLAGCSGSIDTVDVPASTTPAAGPTPPVAGPGASAPATPGRPSPLPAEACRATPTPVKGTGSCEVARDMFVVEPVGIRWSGTVAPWKAGAAGILDVRFRNEASNSAIHYPGVSISSRDARVAADAETHADGFIHPDRYMIAACTTEAVSHAFEVRADVPSGAQVRFVLTPAVATGNGISSCDGTLRSSSFGVVVP